MKFHASYMFWLLIATTSTALAAAPSEQEKAAARVWINAHLLAADSRPPFSFVLDGRPFASVRDRCLVRREHRNLDAHRIEHAVTWADPATHIEVRCIAVEFTDYPAVEWVLHLRNGGLDKSPLLENILPLDEQLVTADSPCTLHYSLGDSNSADSFAPREKPLPPDDSTPFVLAPAGGRSSDQYLPFFNLAGPDGGQALAIGWSGQWEARFERTDKKLRVSAGQQLTHLSLLPDESIRTPRILLVFWQGNQPLRGNNLLRSVMIDHYLPRRDGRIVFPPICASIGATAPDGTYETPHIQAVAPMAERGIEVFWSDMDPQQWYPGGFPEGTGTWEVDPAKYPHGLKPIGQAIKAAGLQYLLWFEPERVHPGTKIDREHPEWVMKSQGEWSQLFRLHDPQARRWITDLVDRHATEASLMWIRWDFNIDPLGFWRRNDAPDRQGITEIRHIENLYAMWDDLEARHPGLLIDNCASGGRRIDLETCTRGLPLWHSDMQCTTVAPVADQLQNAGLFRWVPLHGCANVAYEPAYVFRSAMTAGNILTSNVTEPDAAPAVRRTVAIYKKLRPYMLGDYYPLFGHLNAEDTWFGHQFHRADRGDGAAIVFRRAKCKEPTAILPLNGLDESAEYEVTYEDVPDKTLVTGGNLKKYGIKIDPSPGSAILYYRKR